MKAHAILFLNIVLLPNSNSKFIKKKNHVIDQDYGEKKNVFIVHSY